MGVVSLGLVMVRSIEGLVVCAVLFGAFFGAFQAVDFAVKYVGENVRSDGS